MTTATTIAVIGCGPGGMFFCHALESYRRELVAKGDLEALENLPKVTCLERASGPGGVWRAKRSFADSEAADRSNDDAEEEKKTNEGENEQEVDEPTNMYEALWTNGAKENIEFYDYTYVDHFGTQPLPVYMPRQALLEYMVARVTNNCPDFFDKYAKFNTTVVSVKYIDEKNNFEIITQNMLTREFVTKEYDKCIWAAGTNGHPKIPASVLQSLREGGFKGRIIHSSDTSNFEQDVKGKRILMVGGSYSAEDLALMAIKVGVEKIFISSRNDWNVITWTSAWPQNKVEPLKNLTLVDSTEDGTIRFSKTAWKYPDDYVAVDKNVISREIHDIDTVIFCTGYLPNYDMLESSLRAPFDKPYDNRLKVPSGWKMNSNNLTEFVGEVEPSDTVMWRQSLVWYPDIYRGLSIPNQNMMFIGEELSSSPLFGTDISAWLLLRFCTGTRAIPSPEDMRRQNEEDALRQMKLPYFRYYMDRKYNEACNANWSNISPLFDSVTWYDEFDRYTQRLLQEADYPGLNFGTGDEPNEVAKTLRKHDKMSYYHKYNLDPNNKDECEWRTFRDCNDAELFRSLHTGTPAAPLNKHWMDIDAEAESTLYRQQSPRKENTPRVTF